MVSLKDSRIKPVLVFGYGNLSRGDDALGPLALEYIENNPRLDDIELLTDFQLQIEHALDIQQRKLVLFIDASVKNDQIFSFEQLHPQRDNSYTTHAMSPGAVLTVYEQFFHHNPPPSFLLAIKGEHFELGSELSPLAQTNLQKACCFLNNLLEKPELTKWLECIASIKQYQSQSEPDVS